MYDLQFNYILYDDKENLINRKHIFKKNNS